METYSITSPKIVFEDGTGPYFFMAWCLIKVQGQIYLY
jgi:hypothetical protein